MKLTSGSASRVMWCRFFFLGPVNETLRFTSTTEDSERISLHQRQWCIYFILLFFKPEFLPSILSISANVKAQDKGFNKL